MSGKGFTPLSNGKGGNHAKDDDSAKSKKTSRNVHFASTAASPAAASTKGKGGKGDTAGAAGKKEQEPLQLKVETELPKGAKCLMDCEAVDVLQGIQEQMVILSKDPTIKLPVSFDRGLQYTKKSIHYTDPVSVRRVLESLKTYGVTDGEICVIANVYPDNADEVFALLPSLKDRRIMLDDPINDVLSELAKLKKRA